MKKSEFRKIIKEEIKLLAEGISNKDINEYLDTALWSTVDDNGDPLDGNYSVNDIDRSVVKQAKIDLTKFYAKAKNILENGDYEGDWRHDFWLTRNGHGAGFWDDKGEDGDKLTKISDKFKEINLYVGDDGKIYGM